jgi:hypothetical protein
MSSKVDMTGTLGSLGFLEKKLLQEVQLILITAIHYSILFSLYPYSLELL